MIDEESFRSHQGDGLFHTVAYFPRSFELTSHFALAGDADGDFQVQFSDFLVFSDNFGNRGDWTQGDFDQDELVQFSDFLLLSDNFGKTATISAVQIPEPASAVWSVTCLLVFFTRASRTRRN